MTNYMMFGVNSKGKIDKFYGLSMQDAKNIDEVTKLKSVKMKMPANMMHGATYQGKFSAAKGGPDGTFFIPFTPSVYVTAPKATFLEEDEIQTKGTK